MREQNKQHKENSSADDNCVYNIIIKNLMLAGFFGYLIWAFFSLHLEPDFIFDRVFFALISLFFFFFWKRLHTQWYSLLAGFIALLLHSLKLYGNSYYSIEFDIIMHLIGAIALTMIAFDYLLHDSLSRSEKIMLGKIFVFAAMFTCGMGTIVEITEYFGYANLPPGEGLLHFGTGDEGQWLDSVTDMLMNLIGAMIAGAVMVVGCWEKKNAGMLGREQIRHNIK